jgi:fucose permease
MNSTVEQLFSISAVEVTLNTLLFPIAHTFFAYPCNWIINRYGIRISYFIGGGFVVGGVWLRTFLSEGNPYLCLLGSLTGAIGSIFILNTGSKLAFSWFRSEVVPFITFVFVFANLLSLAVSLIISGFIIDSNSTQQDVLNYLRI